MHIQCTTLIVRYANDSALYVPILRKVSTPSEAIARQALHCKDIYFTHPVTEKEMHITCDYPTDIKNII